MSGMKTYLLKIHLERARNISIGKLGTFSFAEGVYWYVGSAKKNLKQRVARHVRKTKRLHWHIDYLLKYAKITAIWSTDMSEERLAGMLADELAIPVIGFGASDKKAKAHLFYGEQDDRFTDIRKQARIQPLEP
jgi:sugar fermentation stimulation protein A